MLIFEIAMKPTGMSRFKNGKRRPEAFYRVEADSTSDAALKAREWAEFDGFDGYAITSIKEVEK